MTKKHFIAIAAAFACHGRQTWSDDGIAAVAGLAGAIADIAAKDNPLFDRARFLTACKLEK